MTKTDIKSSEHKSVIELVADLLSELGEHALNDSVKSITQKASYLEDKVGELEEELIQHQEARRRLEKIDEAECSMSVWDSICCAIQIITPPEK